MSAKTFLWLEYTVACNIVNNALYQSHSLGGSAKNDKQ